MTTMNPIRKHLSTTWICGEISWLVGFSHVQTGNPRFWGTTPHRTVGHIPLHPEYVYIYIFNVFHYTHSLYVIIYIYVYTYCFGTWVH